jgi:hypothetical protein
MKVRYSAHVDPDVKYSNQTFADLLQIYLADPDGWSSKGYVFEYDPKASLVIRLSSPRTIRKECGLPKGLSCAVMSGNKMWLNSERWLKGAPESKMSLDSYRQYMVSHEMGHILGHDHEKCPGKGMVAPIMLQQTLGLKGCRPNTKVF